MRSVSTHFEPSLSSLHLMVRRAITGSHVPSLHLPPFSHEDPALWFLQAEAQFAARGIEHEHLQYGLTVSMLPTSVAQEVRDCLEMGAHQLQAPYTHLKETIVKDNVLI